MMSDIPPQKPLPQPGKPSSKSGAMVIIIVILAIGVVSSLCICGSVVYLARTSIRELQSSNNLKQIGLAMHAYHAAHDTFPPAYTVDEDGNRLHSWRTLILPQLEQQNLYDGLDLSQPWDSPANRAAADVPLRLFQSPHDDHRGGPVTNYVVVTCDPESGDTMFAEHKASQSMDFSINAIRDGTSNTIMIVEIVNSDIHWAEPRDLSLDEMRRVEEGAHFTERNVMPRRAVALFADGSVRVTSDQLDAETFRKFLSPAGGESADWPEE